MISIINPIFDYCTGIPKKDDTSETTVQSLHCLSPYIYDSSQYLAIFYCFFFNKKQWVAGIKFFSWKRLNFKFILRNWDIGMFAKRRKRIKTCKKTLIVVQYNSWFLNIKKVTSSNTVKDFVSSYAVIY